MCFILIPGYDTSILKGHASQGYWASRSRGVGNLGANMSGFAIGVTGQDAPVSPTQPTIERLTIRRRRGVGLRDYDPERAWRSAFISKFGSTSARPALLGGSAPRWPSSTIGCCATSA